MGDECRGIRCNKYKGGTFRYRHDLYLMIRQISWLRWDNLITVTHICCSLCTLFWILKDPRCFYQIFTCNEYDIFKNVFFYIFQIDKKISLISFFRFLPIGITLSAFFISLSYKFAYLRYLANWLRKSTHLIFKNFY